MRNILFLLATLSLYSCKDTSLTIADILAENEIKKTEVLDILSNTYLNTTKIYYNNSDTVHLVNYREAFLHLDTANKKAVLTTTEPSSKVDSNITESYKKKWLKLKEIEDKNYPEDELKARLDISARNSDKEILQYIKSSKNIQERFAYKIAKDGGIFRAYSNVNNLKTSDKNIDFKVATTHQGQLTLTHDSINNSVVPSTYFNYLDKNTTEIKAATKVHVSITTQKESNPDNISFPISGDFYITDTIYYQDSKHNEKYKKDFNTGFKTGNISGNILQSKGEEPREFTIERIEKYDIVVLTSQNALEPLTYLPFHISEQGDKIILTAELENGQSNLPIFEIPFENQENSEYASRIIIKINLTKR
ncbi:hypothetical protein ORI89_13765 [Sphingobacterium sp. UT-1RO-CII-1]|uniref:hypothetical protein n=1 Tax=Sphingobacterium sp. UT-1RO-CII-1 TaxID=2995225 RepID=UPI00227BC46D|nr:hypothetical protein [Sphingobacterium sp. UT-1RO-CII-1]MCY4780720.1 hypothetical protein [Sphingobacterium sp. UT-1RO-CII-1]